jgi:uncharacterized protein (DUF427 family)
MLLKSAVKRVYLYSQCLLSSKAMSSQSTALDTSSGRKIESVWDFPRPAKLEPISDEIRVVFNGVEVARTTQGHRIIETSHPPSYYIPLEDVREEFLVEIPRKSSFCEWKGVAKYYDLVVGDKTSRAAAWRYATPNQRVVQNQPHGWGNYGSGAATGLGGTFGPIANSISFYASKVDEAYVAGERVIPQPGDFYGGWITSWIDGEKRGFKGGPGTSGW